MLVASYLDALDLVLAAGVDSIIDLDRVIARCINTFLLDARLKIASLLHERKDLDATFFDQIVIDGALFVNRNELFEPALGNKILRDNLDKCKYAGLDVDRQIDCIGLGAIVLLHVD